MNKRDARNQSLLLLSRPLCRRYFAGFFSSTFMLVHGTDGAREQAVHWVFGCLRDGECELLGAWAQVGIGSALPEDMFTDLEIRGVERIHFIVGGDWSDVGAGQRVLPLVATELPSIEQTLAITVAQAVPRHRGAVSSALRAVASTGSSEAAGAALRAFERGQWGESYPQIVAQWRLVLAQWSPVFALPAALRRVAVSGDRMAANLHASLVRAVNRHGCFADRAGAVDFVTSALLRAERRLDRERVAAMAQPRSHRVAVAGAPAALGFH